jgi:2-oxoisovalerate dehydrogenase E1 component
MRQLTFVRLPSTGFNVLNKANGANVDRNLAAYKTLFTAREIDVDEAALVGRGEAFFHVSGAGHESSAALARHLTPDDYLHCHYRDKALLLARGVPPPMFFHSLLCNASGHSAGRQMSAHLSDPARNVLSLVGPIGNNALQAVGVAAQVKGRPSQPLVLCSMGDGTTQQGEVLEAIAEAVRWELPVLFLIHDNRYSISTKTPGRTLFSHPHGDPAEYYGLPIHRIDGRDALACDEAFGVIVEAIRSTRRPALVVMSVDRLCDHTNADDETVYRSPEEVTSARESGDPIVILRRKLVEAGVPEADLTRLEEEVRVEVRAAADEALAAGDPQPVTTAKRSLPERLTSTASEYLGDGNEPRLTMADALRETLKTRMAADARVTLYGEDIEDPKGDVFGVTKGLTRAYPSRVRNSPVSESTIVGTSIGRALAGGRPVAFIQFADFLPLAFNQIATELGSMHWRTDGGWECPVVVMVACGGYRPGLGPFHAHTFESVIAHVPGVDVCMPATAADAAGMLNAAFEGGRPTLFFYPKARLNDRQSTTSPDVGRHLVPVGRSRLARRGDDLTLVGWGSTVQICEGAADALAVAGCSADVIDLRWLSPWDQERVVASASRTGRLIVVHEDNRTCGFGAEVVATVAEAATVPVQARRVTRPDTYVPCHFGNQLEVLPSFKRVLTVAAEMLDLDLSWEAEPPPPPGTVVVNAIGSSPADESLLVAKLEVGVGDVVGAGDAIACLDCDKAVFDLTSPFAGTVETIHVTVGQTVPVGTPLVTLHTGATSLRTRQPTREEPGTPRLRRRRAQTATDRQAGPRAATRLAVGLSTVYAVEGSGRLTNAELVARFPSETDESIVRRTGVRSRPRLAAGETALSMAVAAARAALAGEGLRVADLDLIVCSTSTPPMISPSTACLVLEELARGRTGVEMPAYDISAACTGYIYALSAAYDFLQTRPSGRVLVLTTEAMSTAVNENDFGTAILFGDAATATVLYGDAHRERAKALLHRPVISAAGEDGTSLAVPLPGSGGHVRMDGRAVFAGAVRRMIEMLEQACAELGIGVDDLDLIVPHQANGRIVEAVRARLNGAAGRVVNDVGDRGNTSSSTIPLVLCRLMERRLPEGKLGLSAFGAGFTFAAAVMELVP